MYTALKSCKNKVARSRTSVSELTDVVELVFKKWNLNTPDDGARHVCSGPEKPGTFDQLEAASLDNFNATVTKPSLPHYSTYCVAGSSPMLNFFWVDDSGGHLGLTDALYDLADKLKSTLTSQIPSGLLGYWNSPKPKKSNPVDIRGSHVPSRTLLRDASRRGEKIYLSRDGNLAAVADAQARVLLVLVRTAVQSKVR